ncbi:hopanoid-associated phosphorylase [Caulobacter sp. S45]|uniref:phosphorylase family protein n=1 Tax=Caulobacter sp. S45 TaxID=1641861 RepID=UPI001575A499|nr:hopanoid-associated phosphorylase [Caulobacter sp. S45]
MIAPLIAVVGLQREARLVTRPGIVAVASGGDALGLQARIGRLTERQRPRAIVSVGLGGALSPGLDVGDWVVADRIVQGAQSWWTDALLTGRLLAAMRPGFTGAIAGSDVMVVDAAAKAALHTATGALAVDMESHVAAAFATAHGIPFAALRVISDGAGRALPRAAQAGMKADGGMDVLAVLKALARDPRQLPALIRTGREAEVAFRQLALLNRHDLLGRLGVGDADLGELALDVV